MESEWTWSEFLNGKKDTAEQILGSEEVNKFKRAWLCELQSRLQELNYLKTVVRKKLSENSLHQTKILPLNIGQYPAKNWVMSNECYLTTDKVFQLEAEISFISYRRRKTQTHSVSIGLSCSDFSCYAHFNTKFTDAVLKKP